MSEGAKGGRQRVGRRLGLSPYYRIVERGPGRLRLESTPEANRGPGARIAAAGGALIVAAALIIGSGVVAAGQGAGFGVAALSAVVAGVLVSLGVPRAIGGYAAATTRNSIVADAAAEQIIFTQTSRVGRERHQRLGFQEVGEIRLRRRPLAVGSLLRQVRPIVALELLVGPEIWVVDSAQRGEELQELAAALHEVMGRAF